MSVTYIKRHRMEVNLRRRSFPPPRLPAGYRLLPWSSKLLEDHAEAMCSSFHGEMDADVFQCLDQFEGCLNLMQDIANGSGFLPEATWLVVANDECGQSDVCATIQGTKLDHLFGAIHNVGVLPYHRGRGIGAALVTAALIGFQQGGLPHAYLEVTARNTKAIRLYQQLGFRRTKTLYKTVELSFS